MGTAQRIIGNLHVVSEHYIACWVIVDEHHMYHSIKIYGINVYKYQYFCILFIKINN